LLQVENDAVAAPDPGDSAGLVDANARLSNLFLDVGQPPDRSPPQNPQRRIGTIQDQSGLFRSVDHPVPFFRKEGEPGAVGRQRNGLEGKQVHGSAGKKSKQLDALSCVSLGRHAIVFDSFAFECHRYSLC
jgi:hypothetical protein